MGQPKRSISVVSQSHATPGPGRYNHEKNSNPAVWSQRPGPLFGYEGINNNEGANLESAKTWVGPGRYEPKPLMPGQHKIILGAR